MRSCAARAPVRASTLADLATTDWNDSPVLEHDDTTLELALERQLFLVKSILQRAVRGSEELILLLEDDLLFNRYLRHNLRKWCPVRKLNSEQHFFASLYNPGVKLLQWFPDLAYGEACANSVLGSQAFLLSRTTARYMLTFWGIEPVAYVDLKLARLAARVSPIFYHVPSLVEHVGYTSVWGGPFTSSIDFDRHWLNLDCRPF